MGVAKCTDVVVVVVVVYQWCMSSQRPGRYHHINDSDDDHGWQMTTIRGCHTVSTSVPLNDQGAPWPTARGMMGRKGC